MRYFIISSCGPRNIHGAPFVAPLGKERMVLRVRPPRGLSLASSTFLAASALTVTACAATDPMNALAPAGPVARMEADLFNFIYYLALAVFVLVEALLVWSVIRHRRRPNDGIPHQTHGNTALELTWTIIPCIILIVISIPTVSTIAAASARPTGPDVVTVKVIGHQWWWEFEYPDLGVVTADEMHIPVGKQIAVEVRSADVIHSFWVPKLGGKMQAIPNQDNHTWIQADEAGTFKAQCYQLCGTSHANMRFEVVAQSPADFDAWVQNQKAPPAQSTDAQAQKGEQVFMSSACIGCHTINGTKAQAKIGPNLTHIGSHQTLAGAIMPNTAENLALWLHDPEALKPGSLMPNLHLTGEQVQALVAYLHSLK